MFLILLVSSMAAWVLARYKTKMSRFVFAVFAISTLVPFQCVMIPTVQLAKKFNLMNPAGLIFRQFESNTPNSFNLDAAVNAVQLLS